MILIMINLSSVNEVLSTQGKAGMPSSEENTIKTYEQETQQKMQVKNFPEAEKTSRKLREGTACLCTGRTEWKTKRVNKKLDSRDPRDLLATAVWSFEKKELRTRGTSESQGKRFGFQYKHVKPTSHANQRVPSPPGETLSSI